MRLLIPVLIW